VYAVVLMWFYCQNETRWIKQRVSMYTSTQWTELWSCCRITSGGLWLWLLVWMLAFIKGKVFHVLNYLSTIPWRHGGVEIQLHLSWPQHYVEASLFHTPCRLIPISIVYGAGWAPKACLTAVEIRNKSIPGNRTRAVLPLASRYTQTGSGVHPTSYTMGTGSSFLGVKRLGREVDHSPPTNAEVKKVWIYTSTPPYAFIA
jgi:hypothetical protein